MLIEILSTMRMVNFFSFSSSLDQKKNISKRERQNELKSVLYETIKLTDTLKKQLKKLESSGLVYDSHPPKY